MRISLVAGAPNGKACNDCAIRDFGVCAALDKTDLRELEHLSRHVRFASCETVFAQEEMTTSVYNLLEGVLRLYKLLPDGRRQIVGFVLPGDFLGMPISVRHSFSADAIGAVTVCRLSRTAFARYTENKPHLLRRINELAVRELSQARDHMVLLGRRSAAEKVATFLIGWRDRLVQLNGPSTTVALPMNRQDIADFLGLTIETVSRTFTKLERDHVIGVLPGSVYLLDPARAEAMAAA
ncbi:cyclic nucleotide-binding domain-containing protein [Bradyrhizobium sp.]|uniref:helix-turn-helix domain-containing protein n=1 Tax=Bradyrhizobium sp. TaxID=376 RepID=UPI000A6FB573|nr:cyclic nucleotide-binding domain-containing protein [Bradyrhizobium sp.]